MMFEVKINKLVVPKAFENNFWDNFNVYKLLFTWKAHPYSVPLNYGIVSTSYSVLQRFLGCLKIYVFFQNFLVCYRYVHNKFTSFLEIED